jgi:hypothetical protein
MKKMCAYKKGVLNNLSLRNLDIGILHWFMVTFCIGYRHYIIWLLMVHTPILMYNCYTAGRGTEITLNNKASRFPIQYTRMGLERTEVVQMAI